MSFPIEFCSYKTFSVKTFLTCLQIGTFYEGCVKIKLEIGLNLKINDFLQFPWELAEISLHVRIYGQDLPFYIYFYIWEIKFNDWSKKKQNISTALSKLKKKLVYLKKVIALCFACVQFIKRYLYGRHPVLMLESSLSHLKWMWFHHQGLLKLNPITVLPSLFCACIKNWVFSYEL